MSKGIVGVKGELDEIVTQVDNKLQEIDSSVKERTENQICIDKSKMNAKLILKNIEGTENKTHHQEPICIEETGNSESENEIKRANNLIVEVFVDIAQVYSLETNRKNDIMKGVPAGELEGQVEILKISFFCTDGKISVRINLPLFSTVVPSNIR